MESYTSLTVVDPLISYQNFNGQSVSAVDAEITCSRAGFFQDIRRFRPMSGNAAYKLTLLPIENCFWWHIRSSFQIIVSTSNPTETQVSGGVSHFGTKCNGQDHKIGEVVHSIWLSAMLFAHVKGGSIWAVFEIRTCGFLLRLLSKNFLSQCTHTRIY
jgi:hypothetical protein